MWFAGEEIFGFQWGHDPEVMVSIAPPYTVAITEYTFQWGHDPEVMVR